MVIGDARFASAWRTEAGMERHFDDIGCMVNARRRDHPSGNVRFFVHDYASEDWLDATSAVYVVTPAIRTPMAYGVAALARGSAAAAIAAPDMAEATIAWDDLSARLERKG
jgi:copper chaperone NosL